LIENRRYERVPFFGRVGLTPMAGGPTIEAAAVDISLGGFGVISPKPLKAGDLVRASFPHRDGNGREVVETVPARVAFVRADFEGNRLGLEFLEPLNRATHPALARKVERL
jgi:hypothetical protein